MNPQEKDWVTTLVRRLKETDGQPKDVDAEVLIHRAIADQVDAPYHLVQTVLIQDLSLTHAQARIAALEKQLVEPRSSSGVSFLGGLFGRVQQTDNRAPTDLRSGPAPQIRPSLASPMEPAASVPNAVTPTGAGFFGGGFLQSAVTTAAGVAGGALLFQGISSIFGHHGATSLPANQAVISTLGESVPLRDGADGPDVNYGGGTAGESDEAPAESSSIVQDVDPGAQDYGSSGEVGPA
jgi:hypothetical protein